MKSSESDTYKAQSIPVHHSHLLSGRVELEHARQRLSSGYTSHKQLAILLLACWDQLQRIRNERERPRSESPTRVAGQYCALRAYGLPLAEGGRDRGTAPEMDVMKLLFQPVLLISE